MIETLIKTITQAEGQGFYPAKVVLVNSGDIRVYELEVTCTPSTTQAEILFSAPTMQSVVQEIPIVSQDNTKL